MLYEVITGNWWDATKASELTDLMISEGADVFLSISGGATQGVISKCQDLGKYLIHFDSNGYDKAPGTIVGSTIIKQKELTYKLVTDFINGKLPFGKADTFSAKDGYIDFIESDRITSYNVCYTKLLRIIQQYPYHYFIFKNMMPFIKCYINNLMFMNC